MKRGKAQRLKLKAQGKVQGPRAKREERGLRGDGGDLRERVLRAGRRVYQALRKFVPFAL